MSTVAGAAAVAAEHQLVPGQQCITREGGGLLQVVPEGRQGGEHLLKGAQGA